MQVTKGDLPSELREQVKEGVWDFSGKDVGLIKGVEPVRIEVRKDAQYPRIPKY